ncbi:MAG TPA: hypothetical protein VMR66_09695 [Gemmatimonadota bacterium]|nr:hypothetical protein [Gemmatimonadota bacterium]
MRGRVAVLGGLVALQAGWFVFDGAHAIMTGDYVTPTAGSHAGQLGPWASVVRAVGVNPRAAGMQAFFLAYGTIWLVMAAVLLPRLPRGRGMLATLAAGALWYLPFGTLLSALQLGIVASLRPSRDEEVIR